MVCLVDDIFQITEVLCRSQVAEVHYIYFWTAQGELAAAMRFLGNKTSIQQPPEGPLKIREQYMPWTGRNVFGHEIGIANKSRKIVYVALDNLLPVSVWTLDVARPSQLRGIIHE